MNQKSNRLVSRIGRQITGRTSVILTALFRRRWAREVGAIAYESGAGVFVNDIRGTVHLLEWYDAPGLDVDAFENLLTHDYSRGDTSIPPMSSEPEVSEFLAKYIILKRAQNVLEVGSFLGFTSSHMARALGSLSPQGSLTCIDIDKKFLGIAEANVRELAPNCKNLHFILGKSTDASVIQQLTQGFDLIFIDSAHDEDTTRDEAAKYSRLLNPGGALAFHDAICWPGVRRAVTSIAGHFDTLAFATERGCGMALLSKP